MAAQTLYIILDGTAEVLLPAETPELGYVLGGPMKRANGAGRRSAALLTAVAMIAALMAFVGGDRAARVRRARLIR